MDEETLRATRYNAKRLTVSHEDRLNATDHSDGSSTDDTSRDLSPARGPPVPPPRVRLFSGTPSEPLSPLSDGSEKVRSLPSTTSYKPLPPLPTSDSSSNCDASSLDSSNQVVMNTILHTALPQN